MNVPPAIKISTIWQKVNFFFFCAILWVIPSSRILVNPLLILWFLSACVDVFLHKKITIKNLKHNYSFFLLLVFFLLHGIGLLYSSNMKEGLFDIQLLSLIVIFPFIYSVYESNYYETKRNIIYLSFIGGNIIASLYCLSSSFYHAIKSYGLHNLWVNFFGVNAFYFDYFFYEKFSVLLHPTIFSLYLSFCIFLLVILFFNQIKHKLLIGFTILYFLFIIFLVSSRSGFMNVLLVSGYSIWYYVMQKKYSIKTLYVFVALITVFILLNILFNQRLKVSTKNLFSTEKTNNNNEANNTNDRILIWKSALKLISKNIVFGVGTGDLHQELNIQYIKDKNQFAYEKNLNTHNQFLEITVKLGLVGLSVMLLFFLYAAYSAYRTMNFPAMVFISTFFLTAFFEALFNKQAGIYYFVIFYCLYCLNNKYRH